MNYNWLCQWRREYGGRGWLMECFTSGNTWEHLNECERINESKKSAKCHTLCLIGFSNRNGLFACCPLVYPQSAVLLCPSLSQPVLSWLDKTATMSNVPAATWTSSLHLAGNLLSFPLANSKRDKYVRCTRVCLSTVNKSRHLRRNFQLSIHIVAIECVLSDRKSILENSSCLLWLSY